ncbi:MAG: hypothetical protein HC788_02065 [Sphingopyxis sp.]|nr:hypothetical protein [Sphingopyxis sp.]
MKKLTGLLVATSMMTSPAAAQHMTTQGSGLQRAEAVVAVGITIPIGGSKRSDPARVDLRMTRDTLQADGSRLSDLTGRPLRTSIGLALDRNMENHLLINGRPLPEKDQRLGISTVGWVAIGVGVLVVGGAVLYQVADDASE